MNYSLSFHELAEFELNDIAAYYENQVSGLGFSFLDEVERSLHLIQQNPKLFPQIFHVVRRKTLRRFPYSIMYTLSETSIRILAIASQKRRPLYWKNRK